MATVSLDSIRDSVARKYSPLEVDLGTGVIELKQVLRLGKEARKGVLKHMETLDGLDNSEDATDEMLEVAREVILLLAEDARYKLEAAVGGDPLIYLELFNAWMEASQPGEAQSSPA